MTGKACGKEKIDQEMLKYLRSKGKNGLWIYSGNPGNQKTRGNKI